MAIIASTGKLRNKIESLWRVCDAAWFGRDVSTFEQPPNLLNGESTLAVNAAGTGTVGLIGLSVGTNTVVAPNGLTIPAGQIFANLGTSTSTVTDSITAHSGGTQALGTPLTSTTNRVTTVAAAADSVVLPTSVAGKVVMIINSGAFPMQVFGAGTDTINGIATAVGVPQGQGEVIQYRCVTAGSWFSDALTQITFAPVALTTNGAIYPHAAATYTITKGSLYAATLAAPTATVDDGIVITFLSTTAFAHTVTATGLFQCGTTAVNLATCAAQAGAGFSVMAYNGKWVVFATNVITYS